MIDIEGALDFEVYRSHGSRPYERINAPEIDRGPDTFLLRDRDTEPGETYRYRVTIIEGGQAVASFETSVQTPAGAIELYPNHPNPFNPSTSIRFSLDTDADVVLTVYDTSGRRVRTLVNRPMRAGVHTEAWNGTNARGERVASGIYFLRLRAGKQVRTTTMVLLK